MTARMARRRIAFWGLDAAIDTVVRAALEETGFAVAAGAGPPRYRPGDARPLVLLDTRRQGGAETGRDLPDPPPVPLLIGVEGAPGAAQAARWATIAAQHDLYWSLSTGAVMAMDAPSKVFAAAVRAIAGDLCDEGLLMRLETALHETLVNALVHGNLDVPSLNDFEADDQGTAFQEAIEARLADPVLSARRVALTANVAHKSLSLSVHDNGAGLPEELWDRTVREGPAAPNASHSGRGLQLTAMFCDDMALSPDGRTVTMTFALPHRVEA